MVSIAVVVLRIAQAEVEVVLLAEALVLVVAAEVMAVAWVNVSILANSSIKSW